MGVAVAVRRGAGERDLVEGTSRLKEDSARVGTERKIRGGGASRRVWRVSAANGAERRMEWWRRRRSFERQANSRSSLCATGLSGPCTCTFCRQGVRRWKMLQEGTASYGYYVGYFGEYLGHEGGGQLVQRVDPVRHDGQHLLLRCRRDHLRRVVQQPEEHFLHLHRHNR